MNRVVHIPAYFRPLKTKKNIALKDNEPTTEHTLLTEVGNTTVRYEERLVKTGVSDSLVDSERLTKDLSTAIEKLNSDGYEVITVTPVISGLYDFVGVKDRISHDDQGGYGYGYSYTDSLIIVAKQIP